MKRFLSLLVVALLVLPQTVHAAFSTNLSGLSGLQGSWSSTADGYRGSGSGDCFAMSQTSCLADFIYSASVHFNSGTAASLVFRSSGDGKTSYVANIDRAAGNARIFKFSGGSFAGNVGEYALPQPVKNDYAMRVEARGSQLMYFVDDVLAVSATDGAFSSGVAGLLNYSSDVTYQNLMLNSITGSSSKITALSVSEGTLSPLFSESIYSYSLTLPFESSTLSLTAAAAGGYTILQNGAEVQSPVAIPEGKSSLVLKANGGGSTVITVKRVNPKKYYTETYRPQYHVTPEEGWLNDPNGMVYFRGKWHLFYQLDPTTKFAGQLKWWGHAVSSDLVNWEHKPIALEPDEYGSIFSGSAVVDENNSSGLFGSVGGQGLVAFYTSDNTDGSIGERQCMAYSLDEGDTWIKWGGGAPIISNAADPAPFNDKRQFRDPKVFWHAESGQWMMVVAGGLLRFYSSSDLIHWKAEGAQSEINTECPDFYQLPVNGESGNKKWVLSSGGVWYMVGDFKKVDSVWRFVPDSGDRTRFNNAPDVYASQTFSDAPNGRRIKVDWMTDLGYAGSPIQKMTDPWCHALTLPYELGLLYEGGKYIVSQQPVAELSALRTAEHSFVGAAAANLKELKLDKFELNTTIDVSRGGSFSFKLRAGNGQSTEVRYNSASQQLTLDRSRSGKNPLDGFGAAFSATVAPIGGVIELKIFVDWASIELFANGGRAAFTALIYPDRDSFGMDFSASESVLVQSLKVFEQKSIWRSDTASETYDVSYLDVVARLTDLETLASPTGERSFESSSYEKISSYNEQTQKYENWAANEDDGRDTPRTPDGGYLMADISGAGYIARIWSAEPRQGHIKIFIDGSATPEVDMPFSELFGGGETPFNISQLCYDAARGKNCYLPITFGSSCRVVAYGDWGRYYQINYMRFEGGVSVEPFSLPLKLEQQIALSEQNSALGAALSALGQKTQTTIAPGQAVDILNASGAGEVTNISVKLKGLQEDEEWDALSALAISAKWDGEARPSVWSTLGGFFGSITGVNPSETLPCGVSADGTLYANWVMPFDNGAKITISNDSDTPYTIEYSVAREQKTKPETESLMRFHAKWNRLADPEKGERWPDAAFLKTEGAGRFVGTSLHIYKEIGRGDPEYHPDWWWGEGDEKFFVDGEKFPSWFGTGSEDYFGYAWGSWTPFSNAYHSQPFTNGGMWGVGNRLNNRFHITDSVPFGERFEGYIEKYHRDEYANMVFTNFWYLEKGGVDSYEPVSLEARKSYYSKPFPEAAGFYEGEKLVILNATGMQKAETQDMRGFSGSWSGNEQLIFKAEGKDAEVRLRINVPESGYYHLGAAFTKAADFGSAQHYIDGVAIGKAVDLYSPNVVRAPEQRLGVVLLSAGYHTLKVKMTAKNPLSSGWFYGLDYLQLMSAEAAGDADLDFRVTAADALLALKHAAGKTSLTGAGLKNAAMGGERVTAESALAILKLALSDSVIHPA